MNKFLYSRRTRKHKGGFTLVEILVVVVILGILAGLIVPRIMGRPEEARRIKARMQLESLEATLKLFKLDNGFYPDTEQGLQALVEKPTTGRIPIRARYPRILGDRILFMSLRESTIRISISFHWELMERRGERTRALTLLTGRRKP